MGSTSTPPILPPLISPLIKDIEPRGCSTEGGVLVEPMKVTAFANVLGGVFIHERIVKKALHLHLFNNVCKGLSIPRSQSPKTLKA